MNINWDEPFSYQGQLFPTYGNYGGAAYSSGEIGGALEWTGNKKAPYLTQDQLAALDPALGDNYEAVDQLDYLFYQHDVASMLAGNNEKKQAAADLALLQGLIAFDPSAGGAADGEASLYSGVATLAMVVRLVEEGNVSSLSPTLLMAAINDAVGDIEYALSHLDPTELQAGLTDLGYYDQVHDTFYFNFSTSTDSWREELAESLVINTLNVALDPGEDTEFFINTSGAHNEYSLTLTNGDLDIHAGFYIV